MKTYTIVRAFGHAKQVGWDIMSHTEGMSLPNWCSRWVLLRDAKQALKSEGIKYTIVA